MPERALKVRPLAPPLAGLLLLCALASCTDDLPPFCPPYHVGAVEGYVREAGVGVAAPIGARALEGVQRGRIVGVATADSTGWYRLELPTGLYRLEVDPFTAASILSSDSRDTLRIASAVHRYDLSRGRAEITIAVPAELNGLWHSLGLEGTTYDFRSLRESAEDGTLRFVIPRMSPGTYNMTLTLDWSGSRCFLPGTMDAREADRMTVGVDTVSRYTADLRALYASISGRVTGSWQAARAGTPEVEAMADSLSRIGRASCGSDGSFTLKFLVPRKVRLRTRLDDLRQWIGGGSFAAARDFDLQPGDRITDVALVESGIEMRLEGPGDLIYRRVPVIVRNEMGEEFVPNITAANPIAICNLRPGRYYVYLDGRCQDQIWAPQWYDGADRQADATPVDLEEGELRRIVVTLVEGSRIAGDVLTADGLPPPASYGRLFTVSGEPVCPNWQWFEYGMFDFSGLGDGDYYLAVDQYPSAWWWPGTFDFAAAGRITITGHAAVTGLRWSLPPAGQEARP